MKIFYTLFIILFVLLAFIFPVYQSEARDWSENPVKIFGGVISDKTKEIFDTPLNDITSKWCTDIGLDSRYTITRTLCYIKNNSWSYLQYILFIWLTLATIFIIWNGFMLVISPDREKQLGMFKKNLKYIIIWIVILLWFYYFIDIYVWIINLFTD